MPTALAIHTAPIRRETAKDAAAAWLRREIVCGRIEPGTHLGLKETAARLDVSMTPVREAFEQLAAEGLLRIDPYKGARVSDLTAEEYQEIFLMRVGLEGLGHRLGAERATGSDCSRLENCLDRMERARLAGSVDRFVDADRQFHRVILDAAARPSLLDKIISLRISNERYTRAAYLLPSGGMKDTVASHRLILDACRRKDGASAEAVLTEDLRLTYESFHEIYAGKPVPETEAP